MQQARENSRSSALGGAARGLVRILDGATDLGMILATIAITMMMVHIVLELAIRSIFYYGLDAVPEYVMFYYMPAATFFAFAYLTRTDGHIAAQFFTQFLSPRALKVLEGVIAFGLFIFMAVMTWQLAVEASTMTAIGEVHQGARTYVPKWPGRWFLTIGSAAMALYALVIAVRKVMGEETTPAETKPAAQD
jgi:TRAP-type C4-dicarboxylate transport system permease small subunit